MPRDPKLHNGESTPEELTEIHEGVDLELPNKEKEKEEQEIHKEFADEDEPAA
jgi:hypothetical protein